MLLIPAGSALAEVNLNAGARLFVDNNVNGSPDSPNQRSDGYLSLSASAVYHTPLNAAKTCYFIGQTGAVSAFYSKFNNLDSSMLAASAGLYQQLSPTWSGQVTGRGFIRETEQSARDSDGFGATLEIKKQLSRTVWIKGVADHEDNSADLRSYSYTGQTYGAYLGYLPFKDTFLNLGYSHNSRDFESTLPFKPRTQTVFAEVAQRIAKNWYLNGGYAYLDNDSNIAGTAYTNHVLSAGVSLSF